MTFSIKKWVVWLLTLIAVASVERYLWVNYNQPTGDLEWYLDESRAPQYTYFGFDKDNVSFLIDFFSSYDSRLWVAVILSGVMFSLAIFASNRNQGIKKPGVGLLITACLLLMNKYFYQLDMHLWRQQIAFYSFIVAINQTRFLPKVYFVLIAVLFHEMSLLLFTLHFLSSYLVRISRSVVVWGFLLAVANSVVYIGALNLGYFQISIISFFCYVMFLTNQHDFNVRIACVFIVLLSCLSLLGLLFSSYFAVGEASAERLVFLAVMASLFLFFNVSVSTRVENHAILNSKDSVFRLTNSTFLNTRLLRIVFLTLLKVWFVFYYAYASSL